MAQVIIGREADLLKAANDARAFDSELLHDTAARMGLAEVSQWEALIAKGFAEGTTTSTIVRQILAQEVCHG